MEKSTVTAIVIFGLVIVGGLLGGVYFIPWRTVQWGQIEFSPSSLVTVTGQAKSQQKTQIATFSAGVSSVNDNKDTAVSEVNQKVTAIVDAVKSFGIPPSDIQTQNLSVNQNEEQFYEDGRQKTRPGQWRVNNTIEIKLRNVEQANALANLLTQGGATNVYGPNFTVDDTAAAELGLLEAAIADAKVKAEKIAESTQRKLGRTISVSEGYVQAPVLFGRMEAGGGGGADLQPGTGTVSKTVTVTYELK